MGIAKELLGLTRYPTNIYTSTLQFVFYTLIPIAFVSTVPVEILTNRVSFVLLIIGAGIALILLRFSSWVWNKNFRKFVSAGG